VRVRRCTNGNVNTTRRNGGGITRRNAHANTHAHARANAITNANADVHTHADAHTNANAHTNADTNKEHAGHDTFDNRGRSPGQTGRDGQLDTG
jgi:hypothetical protein